MGGELKPLHCYWRLSFTREKNTEILFLIQKKSLVLYWDFLETSMTMTATTLTMMATTLTTTSVESDLYLSVEERDGKK